MTHDPLCRFSRKRAADDKYDDCEYCDLIAKVRADERTQAGARVAELVHWEDGWPENVVVNRASAIYAAESVEDE